MSLKHAILGFLAVSPMSGYDLRKRMSESVAHFWPADQAQIYRTLSQLTEEKLIEVEVIEQDSRPNRRLHRILQTGEAELDRWLAEPLAYQPDREPFLLRLFFVGRIGLDRSMRLLEERAAEAAELAEVLGAIRGQIEAEVPMEHLGLEQTLRLATLSNGIKHAEAEIEWIDDLRQQLKERKWPT